MNPEKIIVDTDPGVDDVLALSLAFNHPEKLKPLLITLSHGNVGVEPCLKNLVALLNVLEKERDFRRHHGLRGADFGKPLVAVGANKPMVKDHAHGEPDFSEDWEGFHGRDGLNGVHSRTTDLLLILKVQLLLFKMAQSSATSPRHRYQRTSRFLINCVRINPSQ
ncbi:Uridine ribohydrolase 1 [Hyphodiscus hymeniophilus]|uniref:Uridine ribohydrolase 1 n=1 Tax=Hyphodiscus hymeniophilus TaxID=353542 RepID=A0A9P6VFW8_9HELO|nr:Uridine ribohydrolase 1 [Hyphodiscus hymeniophilus]